jgi:hypothetical protein
VAILETRSTFSLPFVIFLLRNNPCALHISSLNCDHASLHRMVGTATKTNKHVDGVIVSRNQSRAALFLPLNTFTLPPGFTLFLTLISPIAAPGDGDRYRDEEDQDPSSRPQEQGAGISAQTHSKNHNHARLGHRIHYKLTHTHTHQHTHTHLHLRPLLHTKSLVYAHSRSRK